MRVSILNLGLCAAIALTACAGSPAPAKTAVSTDATFDNLGPEPTIWVTSELGSPHPGELAPDFELVDQNGKTQKLSSYRGQTVVLAFLAGYCPYSKAEQPYLKKLAEDYASKNVRVLGVLVKEDESDYAAYLERMPMPFSIMRDTTAQVGASYAPAKAMPELKNRVPVLVTSNLVIAPDGRIVFFTLLDTSHFDAKLVHLRRALDKLLTEKKG
jgi:peroxiredoxin